MKPEIDSTTPLARDGFDVFDQIWANADLDEREALELAYRELKAARLARIRNQKRS